MRNNYLFTSESVTEGHPDKIADQISDGILDAIIAKDKYARVACETMLTTGIAFVAGEISTKAYVEIPDIIRDVIKDVGYCDASWGFDHHTCSVLTAIHQQSADISMGVDSFSGSDTIRVRSFLQKKQPGIFLIFDQMYQIFHHRSGLTSWGIRVLQNEGLSSMTERLKQISSEEDIAEKSMSSLQQ